MSQPPQSLRITGGSLRGRRLEVPAGQRVRPTAERVREALFNRLAHGGFGEDGQSILMDAQVLDLCCGTGALAFEALSRGAAHAKLVDADPGVMRLARNNADVLGLADACTIHPAKLPAGLPRGPFDLVFLDPPYAEGLVEPILAALAASGSVRQGGLVSVETSAKLDLTAPGGFDLLHEQRYGAARLWLLQADEAG
jgi:16S rRNA (guanine966-N2)-methyltransferase